MKRILLICTVVMTMLMGANAQNQESKVLSGEAFLESLKGSYIELFSEKTCLNSKFAPLWKSEIAKYTEASKADSVLAAIQGGCLGTRIGADAMTYNRKNGSMQFCCAFLHGVNRFEIIGHRISGYDVNEKQLFSHNYHFVEMDAYGNYIFESNDKNNDEFRYFWFMPDSPNSTYHIEFRYGSDKKQLSQMMDGKYAYWMAAGVREQQEDEWRKGIILFVTERLSGE